MRIASSVSLVSLSVSLALAAVPVAAQQAITQDPGQAGGSAEEPTATDGEILVVAQRLRGTVDTAQPPLLELTTEDIAAYGAGSIAELLEALGPQVSSARGRGGGGGPVILVNGTRISSFREMRSYPPEAIEKVEVFPEEVAQQYGYSADQRVVNFVLKANYSSREVELEYGQPWDGGYSTQQAEATYVHIAGQSRLNFNAEWNNSSLLTEAERNVVQAEGTVPLATDPNPANYRSLVGDSASLELTGNMTTRLASNGTSLSLNGTYEREDSLRLQGLDSVLLVGPGADPESQLRSFNPDSPLTVNSRTETYSLGTTLNMPLGKWQMTATIDGSRSDARSLIRQRADTSGLLASALAGDLALNGDLGLITPGGFDEAWTQSDSASAKITAMGRPFYLPAGDVNVTFDAGYDYASIRSTDTRTTGPDTSLKRGNLSAGVNIGVPITSVRDDFGAALGDISLNLSGGVDHLSDFGTLTDWSVGLTWSPFDLLSLNASYIGREAAPSLSQLGSPTIETPNVAVYDLSTGQTVLATLITGGNAALPSQTQRDWKFGAQLELPFLQRSNFSVDYFRNSSSNVASSFPVLTPAIEAAFPGRVTRDAATGRILSIDQRPVTFAEQKSDRIQFGLNLSGSFGKANPQTQGGGFGAAGGAGAGAGAGAPPQGGFGRPRGINADGTPPPGGQQVRQGGQFDPQRFAELRLKICGEGAPPALTPELLAELPAGMQERLKGTDGQYDPEKVAAMRERICSQDGPGFGRGPRGEGNAPDGAAGGAAPGGAAPGGAAGGQAGGPGMAGGPRGPGGRGMGGMGPGGGGDGKGRWMANFQFTHEFSNTVLIAPGVPMLDLLDGDAISGGGQPRDAFTIRGGAFYRGFGTMLNTTYTGSSRIAGTSNLFFDDFIKVNARVFVDFNQQASVLEAMPLLKNTRIGFSIDNIFDARQRVTDDNGVVPIRYQPALVDPVGRSFEIEFRKLF